MSNFAGKAVQNQLGAVNIGRASGVGNPAEKTRLSQLLVDLKEQLALRGARGIIGLQRKFRIMDDDGNQAINYGEFKKAMKECGINTSDEVIHFLCSLCVIFSVFSCHNNVE